jgi:hypothetical protein
MALMERQDRPARRAHQDPMGLTAALERLAPSEQPDQLAPRALLVQPDRQDLMATTAVLVRQERPDLSERLVQLERLALV